MKISSPVVAAATALVISTILIASTSTSCVRAFVTNCYPRKVVRLLDDHKTNNSPQQQHIISHRPLLMTQEGINNNDDEEEDNDYFLNEIIPSDTSFDTNDNNSMYTPQQQQQQQRNDTTTLTDIRLTRARLEHQHTQQFLTRPPLKLPYTTSQKWIQHHFSISTQAEFEQLVNDGDIQNVYISKRPEEYYGKRGEWISWDHYLLGCCAEEEGYRNGKNGTEVVSLLKWQ